MSTSVTSWPQWFEACAHHYKDVRMKMAYYEFGRPLSPRVMARIHRDVLKKFPVTKKSILLDVGGGVGLISKKFKRRVNRVVLTDIVPRMLSAARQLDPQQKCLACEASGLPFRNNRFDRVLCYSVFHYLSDAGHARRVLREFIRVTRPGGLIFVGDVLYPETQLRASARSALQGSSKAPKVFWPKELFHNLDKRKFSPDLFRKFCRKAGAGCSILKQDIPGKATSASRYDVLIRKDIL